MTAATAERVGMDFDELVRAMVAQIPVNRSGKPEGPSRMPRALQLP